MLIGEFTHSIDDKGRIAIPAKFRALFKSGIVVTKGLDNCLFIYSKEEWEKLAQKLTSLPISQASSRAFARLMLAGAMAASLDGQGRIMVPEYLRQYAGLDKKAVLAGLYNRLEVWSTDAWEKFKQETEKAHVDIAEKLRELGI